MSIVSSVLSEFPELNASQREAVVHTEGPLLVIAGPGSGKTLVLVVRTLNILLQELAKPEEILLWTFTEKAAFELRDRLSVAAKKLNYPGDLSSLLTGTIHGISNDFMIRYRQHTALGNNYEVLDDLSQLLFLNDHFGEIIGPASESGLFLHHWRTRWTAIEGARAYFNKITEELIDADKLAADANPMIQAIGQAYQAYVRKLFETNRVDFAHQQKLFLELLRHSEIGSQIKNRVKYIMVDEYQDTNYVQEQLLLTLTESHRNLCVVGDEDQALYRFRGASVRNILEFPQRFQECHTVTLSTNYRSHPAIVAAYDRFMTSHDWENPTGGPPFRYNKTIVPNPDAQFADYPAVIAIWSQSEQDEAQRFADLVCFLRDNRVIEDESQVALLLHSVRLDHSGHYLAALQKRGIRAFCPRARGYFENEEVQLMVACFAVILGYYKEGRGNVAGETLQRLGEYVDEGIHKLAQCCPAPHPLAGYLQRFQSEIDDLQPGETLDRRLADYFYEFIACEPFCTFVQDENHARNLAQFSQLLATFQNYYDYTIVTAHNREYLRYRFFNSFLRLLYQGGINEYEDPNQPFPKGYVQVMTIHQSKGLEFPVVVVGSLAANVSVSKAIDRALTSYYHRQPFEPESRITGFDRMRLHYVAFSRAEKILVLTTNKQPRPHFKPIWQGLEQWPCVRKDQLRALSFPLHQRMVPKKTFSFTSDLKVYETCPRQYEFFRYYEFMPVRSAQILFGSLVHQTIEDIHRQVLDGQAHELNEAWIKDRFDFNFRHLLNRGIRRIGDKQLREAFTQVMNYYHQNEAEMSRVLETEVDVSVEKDGYILAGKIDLLVGDDHKLELLDFKAQPRPNQDDARLEGYYHQLCIYAHILEQRYQKRPERLLLYWTGEPKKQDAVMSFVYRPDAVKQAGARFDKVVACILNRDFAVKTRPDQKVCRECDLRKFCERH